MTNRPTHPISRSPLTVDDLLADLVWPRLLRGPRLALSASRLWIALVTVVAIGLVDQLWSLIWRLDVGVLERFWAIASGSLLLFVRALRSLVEFGASPFGGVNAYGPASMGVGPSSAGSGMADAVMSMAISGPRGLVADTWHALLVLPIMGVILVLGGGAICRSAACEYAANVRLPWRRALAMSWGKILSLIAVRIGPLAVVWLICGGLWLGGFLLLKWAVITLLGGALFGLMLAAGVAAAAILIVFFLGHAMLVPAVMCEGTDAFDALQRAYAYVMTRTGRLLIYIIIAGGAAIIAMAFVWAIAYLGAWITQYMTGVRVHAFMLPGNQQTLSPMPLNTTEGSFKAMAWMTNAWAWGLAAAVFAYGVSLFFSASTLLYLAMRQVCDGQDMHELWMPGMVAGTMAAAVTPAAPATSATTPAPANPVIPAAAPPSAPIPPTPAPGSPPAAGGPNGPGGGPANGPDPADYT